MIQTFFATLFHKLVEAKSHSPALIIGVGAVLLILLVAVLAPLFFGS